MSLAPDDDRRVRKLFDLAYRRIAGLAEHEGGEVVIVIRIERGGRISRASKVSVDEFPLHNGSGEVQT